MLIKDKEPSKEWNIVSREKLLGLTNDLEIASISINDNEMLLLSQTHDEHKVWKYNFSTRKWQKWKEYPALKLKRHSATFDQEAKRAYICDNSQLLRIDINEKEINTLTAFDEELGLIMSNMDDPLIFSKKESVHLRNRRIIKFLIKIRDYFLK